MSRQDWSDLLTSCEGTSVNGVVFAQIDVSAGIDAIPDVTGIGPPDLWGSLSVCTESGSFAPDDRLDGEYQGSATQPGCVQPEPAVIQHDSADGLLPGNLRFDPGSELRRPLSNLGERPEQHRKSAAGSRPGTCSAEIEQEAFGSARPVSPDSAGTTRERSQLPSGLYYAGVIADNGGKVIGSSETNKFREIHENSIWANPDDFGVSLGTARVGSVGETGQDAPPAATAAHWFAVDRYAGMTGSVETDGAGHHGGRSRAPCVTARAVSADHTEISAEEGFVPKCIL